MVRKYPIHIFFTATDCSVENKSLYHTHITSICVAEEAMRRGLNNPQPEGCSGRSAWDAVKLSHLNGVTRKVEGTKRHTWLRMQIRVLIGIAGFDYRAIRRDLIHS